MGLFKRFNDIVTANLNDLIDSWEDPEKMLRQAVREMETALRIAMGGAAKVIAHEKLLEQQTLQNQQQARRWRARAEQAVGNGDDQAARRALGRCLEHEKLVAALGDQLEQAGGTSRRLRRQVDAMRVRLAEAQRKLTLLAARQQVTRARRVMASNLADFGGVNESFGRFERMSEKVERAETEADALAELIGDEPLESPLDLDLEQELAKLKRGES